MYSCIDKIADGILFGRINKRALNRFTGGFAMTCHCGSLSLILSIHSTSQVKITSIPFSSNL